MVNINLFSVNKTKKGISVLHSNKKLKDDPYDDDGILPEDAVDEQQPRDDRPKKPKKQQKKLPSYEPRKILSYGFRLDAPPNNEQPVGFLLLPDGTVCPAPIAEHMFLPKPSTPKQVRETPDPSEVEESKLPDQGPKTPEGSEPEEGEVSESEEEVINEETSEKVDAEDVDGEPFDILQDGYISDEDKDDSSVGSAPSMPSPEVSDEEDPQANALKNVTSWKQSSDPEIKDPEALPLKDMDGDNESDTEEDIEVPSKPAFGVAEFLSRLSDDDIDNDSQKTEEDTSEYNQFYPPGYLAEQPDKQITTNKPAYLVTSNIPRRDSRENRLVNNYPENRYHDARYEDADPRDSYNRGMHHPPEEDRNFHNYGYHDNGYPSYRAPYRNDYRYRRPPQRPPPPRSYHRPPIQRPFRNSSPAVPSQRHPNYFLWVSPRVIQGMVISGGIIRLFIIYCSTMAVAVMLVQIAIERLRLFKKCLSLSHKRLGLPKHAYAKNSFNVISVYMMHSSGNFHKQADRRDSNTGDRPPFSDANQNYASFPEHTERIYRDSNTTYVPTQQYLTRRPNIPAQSENQIQKYGPPIPKIEEVEIQKYPPTQKIFGPPVPPTQRKYNYSKTVSDIKDHNIHSDMSESEDEDKNVSKGIPFSNIPKPIINYYSKAEPFSDIPAPKENVTSDFSLKKVKNFKPFDRNALEMSKFKPLKKGLHDITSFPKSIAGNSLPGHTSIDSLLALYSMEKSDDEDSEVDDTVPSILQTVFGGERRGCPEYTDLKNNEESAVTDKKVTPQNAQKPPSKNKAAPKREMPSPKESEVDKKKKKTTNVLPSQAVVSSNIQSNIIPVQSYSTPFPSTTVTSATFPIASVPNMVTSAPNAAGPGIANPVMFTGGMSMAGMPPAIPIPGVPTPAMPFPRMPMPSIPIPNMPMPGMQVPNMSMPRMPRMQVPTGPMPRMQVPGNPGSGSKFSDNLNSLPVDSNKPEDSSKKLEGKELEDARAAAKARVLQKIAELKAENEKEKCHIGRKPDKVTVSHEELQSRIKVMEEDRLSRTVFNRNPKKQMETATLSTLPNFYQHALKGSSDQTYETFDSKGSKGNNKSDKEPLPPGVQSNFFPPAFPATLPKFQILTVY